jgi:DNA-binding response OmpR family regulator
MTGPQPGSPAPRRHILVVDDDAAIRNMVGRVLSLTYRVTSASDPREALAIAGRESAIDLLLLDVMMPGMNGFELAKQLRQLPSCEKACLIFLTARDFPGDKIKGIQAGARNYIIKPFAIEDLLVRVKKALTH